MLLTWKTNPKSNADNNKKKLQIFILVQNGRQQIHFHRFPDNVILHKYTLENVPI